MPIYLRQSTASQEVPLGYFVDSTDGNTEETGLTIANTDIKIWKTGATTLANKNSGGATHISNGIYYAVLDATDTNTIGPLVVFVKVAGALGVRVECVVLDEAVYDVLFGTTALATTTNITAGTITTATNVTTVNGLASGVITATSIASNAITSAKIATDAIGAAQIAADAIGSSELAATAAGEVADAVLRELIADHDTVAGSLAALVTAIESQTDDIGTAGAGLTAIPWNAAWDAEVQSEVQDALEANHLDHLLATTYDPASKPGAADALLNELVENDSGVARFTANALEEAPSGSGATAAEIWDYATADATVSGSMGELITDNINAPIGTVDTVVDAIKAVTDNLPDSGALTSIATASALATVDTVVDAVKAKTDSLNFGVTGKVDANITHVNEVEVTGDGQSGTEWGPA